MATADLPAPLRSSRAAAPRWRGEDNLGRAVTFIMLAALLLPMLNAGAKYLADRYPVIEITFARYAGHFLYMIIAFAPLHGRRLMKSSMPGVQIFRSTLLCASTLLFIAGLRYLPLPTAAAISFTAPSSSPHCRRSCCASMSAPGAGAPSRPASSAPSSSCVPGRRARIGPPS
jgi:hypothetical protein